ncbi:TPA: P-loop ATPase, partial [Candidatus Bathyarchaeota archaeon]|nr:P-loop ATPase [Candidatus Bathyarchaeota archaeon]
MLASSLALLFSREEEVVACDCDVDAPNLGLWLGITKYDSVEGISTSERAVIDPGKCVECGRCLEACRFGAVEGGDGFSINPLLCEGCGVCQLVCPEGAVDIRPIVNGEIRIKMTSWGFPLVSGQLYPGETGSGRIVQELRRRAEGFRHRIMILDSAAGIGCPVIASITGCDFAVLVTEPTPSSLADMKRVLKVVEHFRIPFGVVVNKWDINPGLSRRIEDWSEEHLLGRIPY